MVQHQLAAPGAVFAQQWCQMWCMLLLSSEMQLVRTWDRCYEEDEPMMSHIKGTARSRTCAYMEKYKHGSQIPRNTARRQIGVVWTA